MVAAVLIREDAFLKRLFTEPPGVTKEAVDVTKPFGFIVAGNETNPSEPHAFLVMPVKETEAAEKLANAEEHRRLYRKHILVGYHNHTPTAAFGRNRRVSALTFNLAFNLNFLEERKLRLKARLKVGNVHAHRAEVSK